MADGSWQNWAVVEVMGHAKFAGLVTEETIAGHGFIRVDVPELGPELPAFTKLLGTGSIYAITPCTEQVARNVARSVRAMPVIAYDPPLLSAPSGRRLDREEDWLDHEDE